MRYSNTSVEQFHLGRLMSGIEEGRIGIPEFQRDFDWNENDIRSLLATVFAGWPAGSLLLLAGDSAIFKLRPIEGAPPLKKVQFGVLDGQQRLTSLYQALYERGEARFAVRWEIGGDQEIDEAIISVRRRQWERSYSTVDQQIERRVIPLSALKSATHFFDWRDQILSRIPEASKAAAVRELITNLYTYRLSAIHDYEFPVVKLDSEVEPSAISRIFEKVNKTGLTLNTFDLVVAKSFDPSWNLRDKWLEAQEDSPQLSAFFGDDGLPLLQAISLLRKGDLRQSAVLELSKHDVQGGWAASVSAAVRVIAFLRAECGVLNRDFLPYANMLAPLIALEESGRVTSDPKTYATWFWNAGFCGLYDAAANTRLVSHFRAMRDGDLRGFESTEDEPKVISLFGATKKGQRALWASANCAYAHHIEKVGGALTDELIAEIEISTLFSREEVQVSFPNQLPDELESEYRSCLNSLLVPKRLGQVVAKLGAAESIHICQRSEFSTYVIPQIPEDASNLLQDWGNYRDNKFDWLFSFIVSRDVSNAIFAITRPGSEETKYATF